MSETTQTQANEVVVNHNPLIDVKEQTFNFRKTKDEETGVEDKRPSVVGKLQIPSVEGIAEILRNGGKGLELLQSAVESVILDYVKSSLGDDKTITTENFNPELYTFDVIANLPDSERRGRGIPKEIWEDFIKSYIEIMPAAIGKSVDVVKKQASILQQKFQPLKNHEQKADILPKFVEMLGIFMTACNEADQYASVIEFLFKKADQFLNQDNSTDLAENLGF